MKQGLPLITTNDVNLLLYHVMCKPEPSYLRGLAHKHISPGTVL